MTVRIWRCLVCDHHVVGSGAACEICGYHLEMPPEMVPVLRKRLVARLEQLAIQRRKARRVMLGLAVLLVAGIIAGVVLFQLGAISFPILPQSNQPR